MNALRILILKRSDIKFKSAKFLAIMKYYGKIVGAFGMVAFKKRKRKRKNIICIRFQGRFKPKPSPLEGM